MRKVTIAFAAFTLLVAGFVLAQVTTAKLPTVPDRTTTITISPNATGATETIAVSTSQPLAINDKVALRIEGSHDGRVYGTLVVNVNGQWVDVQLGSSNVRAQGR
jgi:hypothetical protein